MFQAVHATVNPDVHIAISIDEGVDGVVVNDGLRNQGSVNTHVLGFLKMVAKVEIG